MYILHVLHFPWAITCCHYFTTPSKLSWPAEACMHRDGRGRTTTRAMSLQQACMHREGRGRTTARVPTPHPLNPRPYYITMSLLPVYRRDGGCGVDGWGPLRSSVLLLWHWRLSLFQWRCSLRSPVVLILAATAPLPPPVAGSCSHSCFRLWARVSLACLC
jgi:hypothetical protein